MVLMQRIPLIVVFTLIAISGSSQDGADLFRRNCAACHSIGAGRLVGPDLAGVTAKRDKAWLTSFIKNSAEAIKSGDPIAVAIGKEFNNLFMPPFAGNDSELAAIITFIGSQEGSAQTETADTFLNAATAENTLRGKALFAGNKSFKNAGTPCISCHSVHDAAGIGGSLAKSLNLSYFTLKGSGIKALLQSPPFPAMTSAYASRPLNDQEIYDLAAYLKNTSQKMVKGDVTHIKIPFLLLGMGGWSIFILMLFGLWRMRKRLSVNHEIFARQLATK